MAEKIAEYIRYEGATVAQDLLQDKSLSDEDKYAAARLALNECKFSEDTELLLGEYKGFTTNKGILDATEIFNNARRKSQLESTVKDMYNSYSEGLNFLGDKLGKVKNLYDSLEEESFGKIAEEYNSAVEDFQNELGYISKNMKKEAKKNGWSPEKYNEELGKRLEESEKYKSAKPIIEKYSPIISLNEQIDKYRTDKLKHSIKTKLNESKIESIVKELPEPVEELSTAA